MKEFYTGDNQLKLFETARTVGNRAVGNVIYVDFRGNKIPYGLAEHDPFIDDLNGLPVASEAAVIPMFPDKDTPPEAA
jgi:hypothetical protein